MFTEGIKNAIIVAKEMEERGERLSAVRIDSGDLARLSKEARKAFDEAGLPYIKISVSNDLDEYTIQSLFAQGAPMMPLVLAPSLLPAILSLLWAVSIS